MDSYRIDRGRDRDRGERYNARLAAFDARLSEVDGMTDSDFDELMCNYTFAKNDMSRILDGLLLKLHGRRLNAALSRGWFHVEMIKNQAAYLDAFRRAGFVDVQVLSKAQPCRDDFPIRVFRGCAPGFERRLSWSTSLDTARYFALRNGWHRHAAESLPVEAEVWVATVPREAVLGACGVEKELIVDFEIVEPTRLEVLDPQTAFDPFSISATFALDRPPSWQARGFQ